MFPARASWARRDTIGMASMNIASPTRRSGLSSVIGWPSGSSGNRTRLRPTRLPQVCFGPPGAQVQARTSCPLAHRVAVDLAADHRARHGLLAGCPDCGGGVQAAVAAAVWAFPLAVDARSDADRLAVHV